MPAVTAENAEIRFEGFTPGTEIWGGTQANFLVQVPGAHAKETAVLLNEPAARALAEAAGIEDSPEFREAAARAVGEALLIELAGDGRQLESQIIASRAYLEEHPAVRDRALAALRQ